MPPVTGSNTAYGVSFLLEGIAVDSQADDKFVQFADGRRVICQSVKAHNGVDGSLMVQPKICQLEETFGEYLQRGAPIGIVCLLLATAAWMLGLLILHLCRHSRRQDQPPAGAAVTEQPVVRRPFGLEWVILIPEMSMV